MEPVTDSNKHWMVRVRTSGNPCKTQVCSGRDLARHSREGET